MFDTPVVVALLVLLLALAMVGLWRYVTVVRLNRELRRYRAFVENSRDLVTVVDAAGIITYVSPASRSILGAEPDTVIGRNLADLVHPDDRSMILSLWQQARQTPGETIDTPDFRLERPDGSCVYVQATGRNLLDDAAVRGVLAHTHDVSERRAALDALRSTEEQFRLAQKMEAVGRLAGGIAHDFNNLLTAIEGYTRLLLDEVAADSPLRSDLEQVQRGAERAAALTRQLLAFSRRQMLQPRIVSLNDVVVPIQEMAARLMGADIDLRVELAADTGQVRADPSQLEQVLLNLLVNARDAMPQGGRITVRTRRALIGEQEAAAHPYLVLPGEYAELIVEDEGTGIPDDVMPTIFEPFFTTKEPGKGTGLGLSTVYGIVKQSGGYVWATSEPGAGATFRICLPSVSDSAPAATAPAPAREGERARGETILLIEDEEAVRRLATRVLQRSGYNVIAAPDGRTAIDICRGYSGDIDLVMTDVVMPGLNGPDVVAQLRTMRPDLKALFASGYTRDAIMEQGGFIRPDVAFLEKPFSPATLARKVREVLDNGDDRE